MADADGLRSAIDRLTREPQPVRAEEVIALAETYAAACAELNARLERCAQYLERGLTSEAVHLAECPPNLQHVGRAIRLADATAWERMCVSFGQPRPPHVRLDVLERVIRAAEDARRLSDLLERHRVLALTGAPLAERLNTLSKLRAQNPDNPVWADEIRVLQTARLEQARVEAANAVVAGDENALKALLGELQSPGWIVAPDAAVVEAVTRRLAALRQTKGLAELPLDELLSAQRAKDYERCAAALQRWQEVRDRYAMTVPEDVQVQVQGATTWLASEDRRRTLSEKRTRAASVLRQEEQPVRPKPLARLFLVGAAGAVATLAAVAALWFRHRR